MTAAETTGRKRVYIYLKRTWKNLVLRDTSTISQILNTRIAWPAATSFVRYDSIAVMESENTPEHLLEHKMKILLCTWYDTRFDNAV